MDSLVRSYLEGFRGRTPAARAREGPAPNEGLLAARVARALAVARAAHPDLRVDEMGFAAHLGRSAREDADPAEALVHMNVADLYLAFACLQGVPGAAAALQRRYSSTITRHLSRLGMTDHDLMEEVRQAVLARMLVGEPGRGPGLADYEGRGELGKWIGISAQRLALDTNRADRRRLDLIARLAEQPVFRRFAPEDSLLLHRHRAVLETALKEAVKALDRRDRLILRFHVAGRVSQGQLAKMYRVDRTTISRQLARAHQQIWAHVRRRLAVALRLTPAEVESLLRGVESQLDVSLSSALDSGRGGEGG